MPTQRFEERRVEERLGEGEAEREKERTHAGEGERERMHAGEKEREREHTHAGEKERERECFGSPIYMFFPPPGPALCKLGLARSAVCST